MQDEQDKPKEASESQEGKDKDQYAAIATQVVNELAVGEKFIKPWREKKRPFLKLYINQRRDPKKVGDTLMFSTHQTIVAALYKDRQDAEWLMREEEDEDRTEAINALWSFDYDEMDKPAHDYDKYWDASFFGLAIEDWSHFNKETLTPIPALWDPLAFVIDPQATKINGDRQGRGAARFIYREISRTMQEMKEHGGFFSLKKLEADEKKSQEQRMNKEARDAARGTDTPQGDIDENRYYPLVQGYTWIGGKRYLVEAGNAGTTIVRLQAVKHDYWPLQEYRIYPEPHQFLTPGVPDFTEDKQRARAILQNYTLEAAKFDVLPEYIFDKNRIKNKRQLTSHRSGKYIEGEGDISSAILPLQKPTIHQFSQGIMQELETNAQKALATPEIQQGIMFSQKRSATEIAEASSNVDTRYSLTAALFGISEKNAAGMWLQQYKRNYNGELEKKTVRIIGAFGPKLMPLPKDTFKFKKDPDVKIESRVVSMAKKRDEMNFMASYGAILAQTPGANLRFFAKKMGRYRLTKDEVDRLIPPTIDEMRAEKENDSLSKNSLSGVEIEPTDDHKTHLEIHGKAADTKAKFAHIEAHKKAMMIQRNKPELFAGIPMSEPLPGQPQMPPQQAGPATLPGQVQDMRP